MESVHPEMGVEGETRTRRAMIGSAMKGMQRFKQSWYSVMVLKAGIGLGQVVTLTILLILSTYIPSPISPFAKQTQRSPSCPKPELYQAWMITQIFRLLGCWSVSVWMTCRSETRRRRIADIRAEVERGGNDRVDIPDRSNSRTPTLEAYSTPRLMTSINATPVTMPTSHSSNSLTSSTSSGSSHSSPEVLSTPCMTPSVSLSGEGFRFHTTMGEDGLEEMGLCVEEKENEDYVSCHQSEATRRSRDGDNRSTRAARSFLEGGNYELERGDIELPPARGLAGVIDKAAPFMSKGFGGLSGALFLLGNILAFYPSPAEGVTCYQSAPLLWWGIMAVLAVGWLLIAQVFFVVVIVGIGGQAVLVVLRKTGIVAPLPQLIALRPTQAEPLLQDEIDKIPIVCYVPKPGCPTSPTSSDSSSTFNSPESSTTSSPQSSSTSFPQSTRPSTTRTLSDESGEDGNAKAGKEIDESRLPIPPIYLESHQSTCGICQENYRRPREARAIMLKVDRLRVLGCAHTFHVECIDKWLLESHGSCPFCHRSVKGTMKGKHRAEGGVQAGVETSPRWRLFANSR